MYCYNIFADLKFMSKYKDFLFLSLSKPCICTCVQVHAPVYTPVEVRGQCLDISHHFTPKFLRQDLSLVDLTLKNCLH